MLLLPKTASFKRIPTEYRLLQNYPNPFNPETTIAFHLVEDAFVEVTIYDITGREVNKVLSGFRTAGVNTVRWNGRNAFGNAVASGIYLYRLRASKGNNIIFQTMKKMTLIK